MNQALRNTWLGIIVLFMVLLAAASYVQVLGADELKAHPSNTRQIYQQFGSPRGPILVAGEPIAESIPADSDNFDYQRVYHQPELYSAITGFYSLTYGGTGLESRMNSELSGTADGLFVDRIRNLLTGEPMQGAQVELTIDPQMQQLAYDLIPDGINASIVITNPKTGDILAMVSKPTYDTNLLAVHSGSEATENMKKIQDQNISPYRNLATQETAFPGSSFKIIDTIAMLESEEFTPETTVAVPDSLELPQANVPIRNFYGGACGRVSSAELKWVFAQSCNTPFSQAAMDIGQDAYVDVAERFGFNKSFDIPLAVEASHFETSQLPQATLAQSVLGQVDTQATAMQMNMVAAGIANDGTVMKPQLIDAVRGPDLNLIEDPEPEVFSEAISPEIAQQMTDMMADVQQLGTAAGAKGSPVKFAAKTGTGTIGSIDQAGGVKVNSWITGFAPIDDPQVVVTLVYRNVDYSVGHNLTVQNMQTIMEAVVD